MATNNLLVKAAADKLCKAFGIRLVTNSAVVQLAQNGGFDALFIDLEHSSLSIDDAGRHCAAGLQLGITPFVRVPHHCGNGFVQRVLDGGAMGVVFPHIHDSDDAKAAVAISKYSPLGIRSMTGQLPLFNLRPTPVGTIVFETNATGSSVILMIETRRSVEQVDSIAAVDGVDVLLIGSNDLTIELGEPGDFASAKYRGALEAVSAACRKHGKIFGLAGVYDSPEIQAWGFRELGARFILGQQDSGLLASGTKGCVAAVDAVEARRAN
ncbi:HpcH/HpaI aldolase [Colletotrichum musicola]|uniref:HpcH/HpaI aldolase n=1 Tax=Colletotrichum musicola TaxID=2175873 RepID=A0A8H6N2T6_9PEZI|nr:HpcH/HpaI aldolase [Colletotrichum musicola]